MAPLPSAKNSYSPCPICPICDGKMELVYDRLNQQVCVCVDCHSGVSIPSTAWVVKQIKRSNESK
jgi:hypothetical protein